MKNLVVAMMAAVAASSMMPAMAQDSPKAAPAAASTKAAPPSRVGLVDMAEVFAGYTKFKDMRDELAAEIEKSDAEAKVMVERMQKMQQVVACHRDTFFVFGR